MPSGTERLAPQDTGVHCAGGVGVCSWMEVGGWGSEGCRLGNRQPSGPRGACCARGSPECSGIWWAVISLQFLFQIWQMLRLEFKVWFTSRRQENWPRPSTQVILNMSKLRIEHLGTSETHFIIWYFAVAIVLEVHAPPLPILSVFQVPHTALR